MAKEARRTRLPVRRAQLIAPFGVGAMIVARDGSSLITAGLDHWYDPPEGTGVNSVDETEYMIEEWRLQKELRVSHFRLPPDYRKPRPGQSVPNTWMSVPFLRFPQWYYCPHCHRMKELTLTTRTRDYCPVCFGEKGKCRKLVPVPIVAICENGHIQDFPWRQWVHGTLSPLCKGTLSLRSTGGASLAAMVVICSCGQSRNLAGVTNGGLSIGTDEDKLEFRCCGDRPWLGQEGAGEHVCGLPLLGSQRAASNLYFAQVRSSIYLPRATPQVQEALIQILANPPISSLVNLLAQTGQLVPKRLREFQVPLFEPYTDAEITQAIKIVRGEVPQRQAEEESTDAGSPEQEVRFRRAEFEVLCIQQDQDLLKIRKAEWQKYDPIVSNHFSQVMLVEKLRETRALVGFTRVYPEPKPLSLIKSLLRRDSLPPGEDWLPAYVVYGEGIFLELNENELQKWEFRDEVQNRVLALQQRYDKMKDRRRLPERTISPRFVLIHTLAHLLINRLTFDCGYSSAALRERLYVAADGDKMAGLLIYTAAGDAEGTMGGLVRMGKPGNFEPVLVRALQGATWCSADPVCMEMGHAGGQGPNSLNLAACHNCALVPETACEQFNVFLDRALVVGDFSDSSLGFFSRFSRT